MKEKEREGERERERDRGIERERGGEGERERGWEKDSFVLVELMLNLIFCLLLSNSIYIR